MRISTLKEIKRSQSVIDTFGGYNHGLTASENEFFDMKNMSSDNYPTLSPRKKRGSFDYTGYGNTYTNHKVTSIVAKDNLNYVDNHYVYSNGVNYNERDGSRTKLSETYRDTPEQLVSMGSYIVSFPDKRFFRTFGVEKDEYGEAIEKENYIDNLGGPIARNVSECDGLVFDPCDIDGNVIDSTVDDTAPENPSDGEYWTDTSSIPHSLKRWSASSSMWNSVATSYICIWSNDAYDKFYKGDAVKFKFLYESGVRYADMDVGQLNDLKTGSYIVQNKVKINAGNNQYKKGIIITGMIDSIIAIPKYTDSTQISGTQIDIYTNIPIMDFVIESGNRLWGCRYGEDVDGKFVNEIYASKLGDFSNWEYFAGTSIDSYAASVGTDGPFTGAINYMGYPLFFKENCVHKVYGTMPSNYQIQTLVCRGVMDGAWKSLAIVKDTLFYKCRGGICAFTGSMPTDISDAFGGVKYDITEVDPTKKEWYRAQPGGPVAGSCGNKYYISMKSSEDNAWHLFVYDTTLGTWHREDNTHVLSFAEHNGILYYIDAADYQIKTINPSASPSEADFDWYAETGVLGKRITSGSYTSKYPGKKYISQLVIRMSMDIGSRCMFFIEYDGSGEWEHVLTTTGTVLKSFAMPIRPKRCDTFRLRVEGIGNAKIHSITKYIEKGSDM